MNQSADRRTLLGMIADDLSGACDTGAQFALRGFRTIVLLGAENAAEEAADLLVVTTDSRADSPDVAYEKTRQACLRLQREGARVFYKKIDSTLRGNIGPEIEAVLSACGHPFAVIAPAFPAMGRTLLGGWLYIDDRCAAPGSNLTVLLGVQRIRGVAHIGISGVLLGQAAIADEFRRICGDGNRIIVLDAASEEDLAIIARTAMAFEPTPLLVGSGGLAAHVAAVLAERGRPSPPDPLSQERERGSLVVLFIGSQNPVTAAQVERLIADSQAEVVPLDERTVETACAALSKGQHVVVSIRWAGRGEERGLRELLPLFQEAAVCGLALCGGDTAARVCSLLGAQAVRLEGEIRTGLPWGRLVGGRAHGMAVCTKAGGFGAEDARCAAVDFLRYEG